MLAGIKMTRVLAKGLRQEFSASSKLLFPFILEKFKDKKTQMIEETHLTLEYFYKYSLGVEEVIETVKTSLKDKHTGLKINIMIWI